LYSVLCLHQHSIGYTGDGFYMSKDPTNSIKVLKEMLQRTNQTTKTTKYTYPLPRRGGQAEFIIPSVDSVTQPSTNRDRDRTTTLTEASASTADQHMCTGITCYSACFRGYLAYSVK